jgi:hypothetical protein
MKFKQNLIRLFLITAILLNNSTLNASSYDGDILTIFSKIIPRFIMMSSQKAKIRNDVEICILSDDIDKLEALSLMDKINTNLPNGIKQHKINLLNSNYEKINKCKNSQLIFMFNSSENNIKNAVEFSDKHNILSISYDEKLLQNGVEISLFIGRKVLPYINMKAISKNKIELDNILLRVSKIYIVKDD